MNNLYEYIDPIASPYEAFLFDSTRDLPADSGALALLCRTSLRSAKAKSRFPLTMSTSIGTEGRCHSFSAQMRSFHRACKGVLSPVQYDVIKFDPNLLPHLQDG